MLLQYPRKIERCRPNDKTCKSDKFEDLEFEHSKFNNLRHSPARPDCNPNFKLQDDSEYIEDAFPCPGCDKSYEKAWQLKQHLNCHVKPFTCDQCDGRFSRKQQLEAHMIKYHGHDRPFHCFECGKEFAHKSTLTAHLSSTHNKDRPHQCHICLSSFSLKTHLTRHIKVHSDEKPFQCEICNLPLSNSYNLKVHREREHTNGEKFSFKCDYCQRTFLLLRDLERHVRTHTKERPFSCHICDKHFSEAGSVKRHLLVHTQEKPHCCEICGREFAEKSKLKRHYRVHTNEKPFVCAICAKEFSQNCALKAHLLVHKKYTLIPNMENECNNNDFFSNTVPHVLNNVFDTYDEMALQSSTYNFDIVTHNSALPANVNIEYQDVSII